MSAMFSSGRRWALALVVIITCLPRPAHADTNLQKELAIVAQAVAKFLGGRDEQTIAIGEFPGPPQLAASAGPTIVKVLTEELEKLGITVQRRSTYSVEGRYRDALDAQTKRLAAEISGQVVDRSGAMQFQFKRGVFGDTTLAELFGATAELPASATEEERDELLQQQIDDPKPALDEAKVASSTESPYGIEILVETEGEYQPRPPVEDEGLAFVELQRDETYAVRLINNSPHDAAVTLTIDGLSMYAFSETPFRHVIVLAGTSPVIKGWFRTTELSDKFVITAYADSAAAELSSTAPTGTITATFSAAWAKDAEPPADEPKDPGEFSRSADATGRGPEVSVKYQLVERNIGVVRSTVSVRYNKAAPTPVAE